MPLAALLGPLGPLEIGLILLIVIIVFGVGRLPEVGGAVGKSIKEFRKATRDEEEQPGGAIAQSAAPAGATAAGSVSAPAPSDAAAPADASGDTRFCSECGARNARNAKFCSECGHTMQAAVG